MRYIYFNLIILITMIIKDGKLYKEITFDNLTKEDWQDITDYFKNEWLTLNSLEFSFNAMDTLEYMLIINGLVPKGHTIDMQVEWRLIYNHLQIYKDKLIKDNSENEKFKQALAELVAKIKQFKLDNRPIIPQEKKLDIKDRTVVLWTDEGNEWSTTKTGVRGITYIRNTSIKDIWVKDLINEIQTYGLDQTDAVKLFVLVAWLPKAGYQGSDGKRYGVGNYGYFAFSTVQKGRVGCLYFNDGDAWLGSDSASIALPSLYI